MKKQKTIPAYMKQWVDRIEPHWRTVKRFYNTYQDDTLTLITLGCLVLVAILAVVTLILGCMMIGPFILVWAINTIAPMVGSTVVIPYSIPLLLAIAVVLMVLKSIFSRG